MNSKLFASTHFRFHSISKLQIPVRCDSVIYPHTMQAEDHVDYDALFDAAFDAPSVKAVIEGKVRVVGVNGAAFDIFPSKM